MVLVVQAEEEEAVDEEEDVVDVEVVEAEEATRVVMLSRATRKA